MESAAPHKLSIFGYCRWSYVKKLGIFEIFTKFWINRRGFQFGCAKISLWKFPTKKANFCDFVQIFLISTPPCFTKTRFSHRVTALGSKSRAFLESWQNFTSDEVVFILGPPIFDRFLAQSFRKNRKNSKKIHFRRKFFFSRSILKCLLAGPKIKFGTF